jgi:hypothetical protein
LQTSFLKSHVRMVHGFQKIILLEDDSAAGRDYRNVGICPLRFKKPYSDKRTSQALELANPQPFRPSPIGKLRNLTAERVA